MHLQCGALQKKQVLTCLASRQKSVFWQPIHLGLSSLHTVLKPRGFLCCCFFFVVVVVSAGFLSALYLPGSTFTKLSTPYPQGRAICFYIVSAVCYNSRPPQGGTTVQVHPKQHSHIIMIFFIFLLFWDCPYSLWISNHSYVFIRFGLEHLSCHRVRDGERTGRTCLLNV